MSATDRLACLLKSMELDPLPSPFLVSEAAEWFAGSAMPLAKGSLGCIEASMDGARDVV